MPPIIYLTFVAGLALIVVAVLGGGLEIKEVRIPVLPTVPRALSFTVGCVLLAYAFLIRSFLINHPSTQIRRTQI